MAKHTEEEPLLAGALAKAAGVSTDTLRHYERKGVLQRPRHASNGYRQYQPGARERVSLVRRVLAAAQLAEIEDRLVQLIELRDWLRATFKGVGRALGRNKRRRARRATGDSRCRERHQV